MLVAYAVLTLVSAAFRRARLSLLACKQMVLFLIVPLVCVSRPARGDIDGDDHRLLAAAERRGRNLQYGILLRQPRPASAGTLGHYMTYSGLLMLVIGVALARILFGRRDRLWAALVMPALAVAVVVTFTRSSAVGACAAAALLLSLKDFRLLAVLPVVAAIFFAVAPAALAGRFISTFDLKDPTNRDRLAMLREGEHMIRTHPIVGVGPNMVQVVYGEYRVPDAVETTNPHLHNVPLQIAAERGLPALAAWLWFVVGLIAALATRFRDPDQRFLAAAALAAVVSMLAAGMFEYNFGDSEFLMLFLSVITLPFAAARSTTA